MNLADYAIALHQRVGDGVRVPVRPATVGEWKAEAHFCHANTIEWCKRSPGDTRVPGWLYFDLLDMFGHVRFAAHSVVRTQAGELIDITPSELTRPYPFLPAEEDHSQYDVVIIEQQRVMYLDLYPSLGKVQVHHSGA